MSNSTSETSSSSSLSRYIRYHLRGRRGLIAAAVIVGIPALWTGWPWLAAAGIAPILVALAPCALMCGLGLCMRRGSSGATGTEASCCAKQESADDKAVSMTDNESADRSAMSLTTEVPLQTNPNRSENPANLSTRNKEKSQ